MWIQENGKNIWKEDVKILDKKQCKECGQFMYQKDYPYPKAFARMKYCGRECSNKAKWGKPHPQRANM